MQFLQSSIMLNFQEGVKLDEINSHKYYYIMFVSVYDICSFKLLK